MAIVGKTITVGGINVAVGVAVSVSGIGVFEAVAVGVSVGVCRVADGGMGVAVGGVMAVDGVEHPAGDNSTKITDAKKNLDLISELSPQPADCYSELPPINYATIFAQWWFIRNIGS
ncbi:hypothetical protein ACFLV7_16655 [Chloroflexota bacterium]